MEKGEDQSLFRDSPPTDDLHSDGEEGSGRCWFTPRGRGRWRFARVERKQSKWRGVSRLTRSQSTAGRDDPASFCCCCGPRWKGMNSKCTDGDGNAGAAREDRGRSGKKGSLLQKFASFNDSSSLRYADGGRVSPALSPLPVRTMSKMERDKQRRMFVPIWQRRATMSPIKALDLRQRTS
ncbi:hypothetical protein KC19_4G077000 [Ceratodon purpureus]|uniref:Uncharacterized protein n=1 Tax=Ceratodon purpureus TaxID=3225 RepID=A0A8T0I9K5_CERPU|nr:hypothetical protein KC19_4G077000 [Ceratodon purpureus]